MTSCLISCALIPFRKKLYRKKKEHYLRSKFFPFRVEAFSDGDKNNFDIVTALESVLVIQFLRFPLK